jgi:hypothetical protein
MIRAITPLAALTEVALADSAPTRPNAPSACDALTEAPETTRAETSDPVAPELLILDPDMTPFAVIVPFAVLCGIDVPFTSYVIAPVWMITAPEP